MHILQVIPFFTPQMGGSAQVAYQISKHLAARGHQVTLVTSDYGIHASRFPEGPFEVIFLPNLVARWGFYFSPSLVSWSRHHLPAYDILHLHTFRTFQNAVVARAASKYDIPYVLSAHGTLPLIVQRQLAKRAYDRLAGRRILAGAGRLVAVSGVEQEQYRQAGISPERIACIPNGLDLNEFVDLPPPETFRNQAGIMGGTKLVLYLGRLHRIKGLDFLIEAFAVLLQECSDCILVIAGPDEGERPALERRAVSLGVMEAVHFVGPLYGRDKLAAYVDADVLVSPAFYEIFGLVPFEAILCGTPIVVGQASGAGDLIGEAQAGYLVAQGDVNSLVFAMRSTFSDREAAAKMVRSGQAFVRKNLDWQVITGQLERLYVEVLGE